MKNISLPLSIAGGLCLGLMLTACTPAAGALGVLNAVKPAVEKESPTPAAAGVKETTRDLVEITVLGVGDILVHRQILDQARADAKRKEKVNFRPMLAGIAPLVKKADLALCHMEYPMGSRNGPWTAWPDLPKAPPQLADALASLGFDACSTASNHTLDQGFTGVVSTIDAIEEAGMTAYGTGRTKKEARTIDIVTVKDIPIALLSYTYSFNGIPLPAGKKWCCNLINTERIINDARTARTLGARIVIVSLHDGVEGYTPPTPQQAELNNTLAKTGQVDLVLGHHAHVIQPVQKIRNMWVAYGHGNLLSAQSRKDPRTGDGLLTLFTFAEQPDGSFQIEAGSGYAIRNADYPFRLQPVPHKDDSLPADNATWQRTRKAVLSLGAQNDGFRMQRGT